ncbi:MAG: hypothetical protein QOD99_877 [Chthoniobacter sp.]|nr:hypothetical protein [Chthoniobacter sp.]
MTVKRNSNSAAGSRLVKIVAVDFLDAVGVFFGHVDIARSLIRFRLLQQQIRVPDALRDLGVERLALIEVSPPKLRMRMKL